MERSHVSVCEGPKRGTKRRVLNCQLQYMYSGDLPERVQFVDEHVSLLALFFLCLFYAIIIITTSYNFTMVVVITPCAKVWKHVYLDMYVYVAYK